MTLYMPTRVLPAIDFKVTRLTPHHCKNACRYKSEIVHRACATRILSTATTNRQAKPPEPKEFLAMKDREDCGVLDVRSNYEHSLASSKTP